MTDEPLDLFLLRGVSEQQLIEAIRREYGDGRYWCGLPIIPAGTAEVQIIRLRGRVEPDIEDEP